MTLETWWRFNHHPALTPRAEDMSKLMSKLMAERRVAIKHINPSMQSVDN